MDIPCTVCGTIFQAKRSSARYCSEKCKKRAQRAPDAGPKLVPLVPVAGQKQAVVTSLEGLVEALAAEAEPDGLAAATERELRAAERMTTALGQAAISLARRIDRSALDTGSSFASLIREHRATLAAALEGAKKTESKLEELRRRRAERREAGA